MPAGRLERYLEEYAAYHTTRGNRICHYVGIPLITVSLLGLLSLLRFGPEIVPGVAALDAGLVFVALVVAWYVVLDLQLGLTFGVVVVGCYVLGRAVPWSYLVAIQVVGWVLQFVGHYRYEKRSPAFFQSLEHLLIGPLWIFAKLVQRTA